MKTLISNSVWAWGCTFEKIFKERIIKRIVRSIMIGLGGRGGWRVGPPLVLVLWLVVGEGTPVVLGVRVGLVRTESSRWPPVHNSGILNARKDITQLFVCRHNQEWNIIDSLLEYFPEISERPEQQNNCPHLWVRAGDLWLTVLLSRTFSLKQFEWQNLLTFWWSSLTGGQTLVIRFLWWSVLLGWDHAGTVQQVLWSL